MAPEGTLPTLPEPQDTAAEQQPAIEIEQVDDTPEQDRGAPAPAPETYQAVDDESQDGKYSQHVQGRIKQLRHVYHQERREKEAAQREREALVGYTQSLQQQIGQLRELVTSGEKVLIDQSQGRAAAEVANARELWRRAHDSGDPEELVKAQEALARAVTEHERMKSLRPAMPPPVVQQPPPQQQFQQPPAQFQQPAAPPQEDPRLNDWVRRHPWWTQDGNDEPKRYLRYVDLELKQNGILPQGQTADAYWATVEQRLQATFPALAGSGAGNANANGQAHTNGREVRNRPVTAASGNRSANAPVKVRLTESQLRMAKRLGVTPENYAKEVLKMGTSG